MRWSRRSRRTAATSASSSYQTQSSPDGDLAAFISRGSFAEPVGSSVTSKYVSKRTADGWSTVNIMPTETSRTFTNVESRYVSELSPDFDRGVVYALSPQTDAPAVAGVPNLYLRTDARDGGRGAYSLISACPGCAAPLPANYTGKTNGAPTTAYAASSAGFGQVLFQSLDNLTAEALDAGLSPESPKVYEWDHGTLRLASILPDGEPAARAVAWDGAGTSTGPVKNTLASAGRAEHAMSTDGRRVFFTADPIQGEHVVSAFGDLYMRVDGARTVQLNVSERLVPDPHGPQPAEFLGATPDGGRVFFATPEDLTEDDNDAVPGEPGPLDLYMYDVGAPVGHHLTLLSQDGEPADDHERGDSNWAGHCESCGPDRVAGLVGSSEDGSYVYFTARAKLVRRTEGEPELKGDNGVAPDPSWYLYAWHDGSVHYVGAVTDAVTQGLGGEGSLSSNGVGPSSSAAARVSGDGRTLLFANRARQTGYDTRGVVDGGAYGSLEVYVYRYGADSTVCASCPPGGAPPNLSAPYHGEASFNLLLRGLSGGFTPHLSQALSRDGAAVYFSTPEPLVPTDTNGRYDAYEYDVLTHQVRLLSTGQCGCDSYFLDADESGENVFFATAQRLVGIDSDSLVDLYDARAGGGIAAQNPLPRVECQGDACQASPSAPGFQTPASASFSGPGSRVSKPRKARHRRKHRRRRHRRKHRHRRHRHRRHRGGRRRHRRVAGSHRPHRRGLRMRREGRAR